MTSALPHFRDWSRLQHTLVCWVILSFLGSFGLLGESQQQRLSRVYEQARGEYSKSPGSASLAWPLARACFDRAEAISSRPVRSALAKEGVEACRLALKESPADAACHYYLGLNLGILAQTQPLRALGLIREMESQWQACLLLDPGFDHAGADRSLGMLYAECPPSPLGVGSRSKARFHLARAVELAPDHPENRILWIEFLIQRGEKATAAEEFKTLKTILPDARIRLRGDAWEETWKTWESRTETLQSRLGVHP
jgi:tetratricopeptide (TPR) repeat protein